MILERFYDDDLAQASYLIGCGASGEALVIDPNRDVDQYVRAAERNALRIAHVAETHIHADFVSGLRELAARTGAQPSLSDEGDAAWRYRFAVDDGAVPLHDGETIHVGAVRLDVLHSPGHTPEHVCFVVTDTAVGDRPVGVFTGDFVFAGDVGRPDLLERVAGERDRSEAAARHLFRSLQSFKQFPDYLQLWPGHGAGSACGRSLGAIPQTTLGYEKMFNWALQHEDEDAFTREVLADQPEPPKYFAEMKRINRDGPRVLGGFERPPRLAPERLAALLPVPDAELRLPDPVAPGALVIDTRSAAEHAAAR
ncbi:MAG: MBL fold metallo-hydrolase, partial [Longimicrobiales bacterium]